MCKRSSCIVEYIKLLGCLASYINLFIYLFIRIYMQCVRVCVCIVTCVNVKCWNVNLIKYSVFCCWDESNKIQITHTIIIHSLIHFRFFFVMLMLLRWHCLHYMCKWEYASLHFEGETVFFLYVLCVCTKATRTKVKLLYSPLSSHPYLSRNSEILLARV